MQIPIIWPRHAWRTKTYEELDVLISNWPKSLQLKWWKEESRAYRKLLQRGLAARHKKKLPRPRAHHKLIEAVISRKPNVRYATFWPLAKKIFDSQRQDFLGISKVDLENRKIYITSSKVAQAKTWPNSKSALTQLIKRIRKRLKR